MQVIFSIGLNVGASEPVRQLADTLGAIAPLLIRAVRMGDSAWEGVPERFIQVRAEVRHGREARLFASHLARVLRQDAVAVLSPGAARWVLVDSGANASDGGTLADFPCIVGRD